MPDDPYTLSDLARLADVTPRTVRYYVAQGLLPSPEAAGPSTRYGEGHLARLRIIKRLQRDHLPLAEIRSRLDRMGDQEVVDAAELLGSPAMAPSRDPDDTLAFIRSLMDQSGVASTIEQQPGRQTALLRRTMTLDTVPPSARSAAPAPPAMAAQRSSPEPPASGPAPDHHTQPDRSTWERLTITSDVEIHVRRPLDRRSNKRIDQLERIARELFEEEH